MSCHAHYPATSFLKGCGWVMTYSTKFLAQMFFTAKLFESSFPPPLSLRSTTDSNSLQNSRYQIPSLTIHLSTSWSSSKTFLPPARLGFQHKKLETPQIALRNNLPLLLFRCQLTALQFSSLMHSWDTLNQLRNHFVRCSVLLWSNVSVATRPVLSTLIDCEYSAIYSLLQIRDNTQTAPSPESIRWYEERETQSPHRHSTRVHTSQQCVTAHVQWASKLPATPHNKCIDP